ncbi:MAG: 50S ribosomal protein L11 methyltransferase [Lachnospiraceae bacterium]|nr:50S ribosomal protein L11 methyltransferase [Lachnospiraceae bacterium]
MKWKKIVLKTTVEAEDLISATLAELGVEGIEIEDKIPITEQEKKEMFIDILPELPPDDGVAYITFYAGEETDLETLLLDGKRELEALSEFTNVGDCTMEVGATEDKDWINNWKEFFKPFMLEEDIVIKPTWVELEEKRPGDVVIEIDPGTAFGTGAHETTKLCIKALKEDLRDGMTVLDLGCGSGILSIIAKRLGASFVLGTDVDKNAVSTAFENTSVNRLDGSLVTFLTGNVIDDSALRAEIAERFEEKSGKRTCDIVVANILADIIIPISAVVGEFMDRDSVFVSSGIIDMKEKEVREALLANGFEIVGAQYMGEWVSLTAKKR